MVHHIEQQPYIVNIVIQKRRRGTLIPLLSMSSFRVRTPDAYSSTIAICCTADLQSTGGVHLSSTFRIVQYLIIGRRNVPLSGFLLCDHGLVFLAYVGSTARRNSRQVAFHPIADLVASLFSEPPVAQCLTGDCLEEAAVVTIEFNDLF